MTDIAPSEHLLLHALADHELDAATALSLEARMAAEPALAAEYARILALKEHVKSLGKPMISEDFVARITAIGAPPKPVPWQRRILSVDHPSWRGLAAGIVLTAFIASGSTYFLVPPRGESAIEDQIADDHRRSLLAASPTDILSSDRHTVRPWFEQKLGCRRRPSIFPARFSAGWGTRRGDRRQCRANSRVPTSPASDYARRDPAGRGASGRNAERKGRRWL